MTAVEGMLGSPRWTAIYRCPKHPQQPEIVMNSYDPPDEERTFRVAGVGNCTFVAVSVTELTKPKGGFRSVAKTKRKRKSRSKKKKEEAAEELEGLEGLDDDLEELDEEEPDEVEEDEDEDEDEPDEDEDDEEEEPPKRKRKKKGSKSKSKGKSKQAPPTRELPKGKYGAQEIAELAGVDARAVRIFLRKKENKKKYPKDSELGRYSFTKKDATRIAKAIKKGSTKDEDEDDE